MDKDILKRSIIVIGLVVLIIAIFVIMGCACPAGVLCCGDKECEGASEDDSCCGSLCPCPSPTSKCCTGESSSNSACCNPSTQHCHSDTVWNDDSQQYFKVWSCGLCATGQKQCGPVCIGASDCCTDGKAGCGSQGSCYDCNNGKCEEKSVTCSYAGNCPLPPGEQSGHSDQCSGLSCTACLTAGFPCPGETGGFYGCLS